MTKFKKLLVTALLVVLLVFSLSICALGAQIDNLSVVDNTIYASISGGDATFYAAEYNEGVLVDVFFCETENGEAELPIDEASEYRLYLWDKESLAPVSVSYNLSDGVAYAQNSTTPVPAYEFSDYSFDQEDDVMIVSAVTETKIKGFKAGVETTYSLIEDVTVLGLSDSMDDVVPGSVVLIGTNKVGNCAAVELLATLGLPVAPETFEANYGVYAASDGSTKYKNIVTVMFSKSGSKITEKVRGGKTYHFESNNVQCYRVGIAMDGETPIITVSNKSVFVSGDDSIFESTTYYSNYLYLRYDTEQSKKLSDGTYTDGLVTQCVLYCVPKDFDPGKGGDGWTEIFSLEPIVIIE